MTDKPSEPYPFLDMWLRSQSAMIDAQRPFWENISKSLTTSENEESARIAQQLWDKSVTASRDWISAAFKNARWEKDANDIAKTTLSKVMDPSQFLLFGSDEVNSTIQKLVDGPGHYSSTDLSDLGAQTTNEWAALREASATYRNIVLKAWWAAYETFLKEHSGGLSKLGHSPNELIQNWLQIANEELTKTQRTKRYLDAQRQLLRAGVDYRLKEQELVEKWCETHSLPTRSEVDELHRSVYELKKSLRDLTKQIADHASAPPSRKKLGSSKSSGEKK